MGRWGVVPGVVMIREGGRGTGWEGGRGIGWEVDRGEDKGRKTAFH